MELSLSEAASVNASRIIYAHHVGDSMSCMGERSQSGHFCCVQESWR